MLKGCDGAGLDQILVHAHQPNNVATRNILNGLHDAPHHQHRPLDGLHVDVLLLPGDVVGAHDPDLLASGNGTREHTSKSVEPPLVTCGHHLADVHDERGLRVRGEGGRVGRGEGGEFSSYCLAYYLGDTRLGGPKRLHVLHKSTYEPRKDLIRG